ncbi:MAG TPA: cytochrome C, partial [Nitrospiraceae bacterium]|nr:cytochrome C [Nitrospiraceae bacterium]
MVLFSKRSLHLAVVIFLFMCAGIYVIACAPAQRKMVSKSCLECHTTFAEKHSNAKSVHTLVKQERCEDCHLRHGIVPRLILVK